MLRLALTLMGFNRATDDASGVADNTKRIIDQFGGALLADTGDYIVWG